MSKEYNWESKEKIIERNKKNAEKRRLTKNKIIEKLKKIKHKFKYIKILNLKEAIHNYKNQQDKIKIKCVYFNDYKEITWKYLFSKEIKQCKFENNYNVYKKKIKRKGWILEETKESFIQKYKENGYKSKINARCLKCNNISIKNFNEFLYSNVGCKYCSNNTFLTYNKFLNKAKEIHDNKYIYDFNEEWWVMNYKHSQKTNIKIKCKKHGFFYQKVFNHLRGNGCPKCSESKGERLLREIFDENGLKYKYQYPKNGFIFDFYLIDFDLYIEYDGIQHFKPIDFAGKGEQWALNNFQKIKENDLKKNKYCLENNLSLIRIPYWTPEEELKRNFFNRLNN